MSEKINENNDMFGHGTIVRRHGDMVEKMYRANPEFMESADVWMYKMQTARDITDKLQNKPAYFVPKTRIENGRVFEDFVSGTKLSDLSDEYIAQNAYWIIPAVANLLNDLSELEPTEHYENMSEYRDMTSVQFLDVDEVTNILSRRRDVIGDDNIEFIKSIYRYLLSLPENHELVFSHNDLSGGNVFIDTENKRVSFIDFEVAGMDTKLHIMYHSHFLGKIPGVWDYINNKLKRTRNKSLVWNYNADVARLYNFVWGVTFDILENNDGDIKQIPARCDDVRKFISNKSMKFNIAAANVPNVAPDTVVNVPNNTHER